MDLIPRARALLQSSQSEKAYELLISHLEQNKDDVAFLQIFGETLLENNDVTTAYEVLSKACELDSDASEGSEKFFYLGQIIGGSEGLQLLDIGLSRLSLQLQSVHDDKGETEKSLVELAKLYTTKNSLMRYLIKKINQGIFAKIEIWMTDLCMEEEAEASCNQLIDYSLSLDPENPEALSLLASIRISQQRVKDAQNSIQKSWDLFSARKTALEDAANSIQQETEENADAFEVGVDYIDLVQPLMTLAKLAIETELYDLGLSIVSNVQDINENILDLYYFEALASLLKAKKIFHSKGKINEEDYRDVAVASLRECEEEEIISLIKDAKSSLTQGYKIINSDSVDADPELIDQMSELLNDVGGPEMSELLPSKRNDIDEDGWEDEIENASEED